MAPEDDLNGGSSDTHDGLLMRATADTPKKIDEVQVVSTVGEGTKYIPDPAKDDRGSPAESSRGTGADHTSDTGSIHSMPAVRISESPTPLADDQLSPMPSPAPSAFSHRPPPSPARSQTLLDSANPVQPHPQRRNRHRSVMLEGGGRSANRLSGFFNNLMHRRETLLPHSRETVQDSAPSQVPSRNHSAPGSEAPSRPASPPAPPRPTTPPPSLPAPTLTELGLSLSTVTSDLSPSHFSAPPTSGAFLAPHYLLLCHPQGLDVVPLLSPPAPQPYALVRRVSFKSVVVMEQRGVLVAIAGRRDGVRVYALDEVKKAIEWRIDVEIRRERERLRRENLKKTATIRSIDGSEFRDHHEKPAKPSLSTPPPGEAHARLRTNLLRKSSNRSIPVLATPPPPVPLIPRSPVARIPKQKSRSSSVQISAASQATVPDLHDHPPPYVQPETSDAQVSLRNQPSALSLLARSRGGSVNSVLSGAIRQRQPGSHDPDAKADWAESSEDEAIDIVAAGASGSQALDERTSATLSANRPSSGLPPVISSARTRSGTLRRNRPSNLDLSLALPTSTAPPPEPSPAPTLLSLRQALAHPPGSVEGEEDNPPPFLDEDEDDDETDGRISLAQALMESRLPDLPPLGTTRAQQPILLSPSSGDRASSSLSVPLEESGGIQQRSGTADGPPSSSRRRRRRWSVLLNHSTEDDYRPPVTAPPTDRSHPFVRSHSFRSHHSQPASVQSALDLPTTSPQPPSSPLSENHPPFSPRSSRFLPRIFSNPFNGRRFEDRVALAAHASDSEATKVIHNPPTNHAPPPKLEYVKLPGTKNALMIKAVETAKKSFLAILCGDNGEKVELFAGTYRTALGLSRTFILPDSPRSLELQLQGDDLVEVFLVFSQNVFGLEPATVRVREVRIGRAERRAARRRARENRAGEGSSIAQEGEAADEDTGVNVTVGVSVPDGNTATATSGDPDRPASPTLIASEHPSAQPERPSTPVDLPSSNSSAQPEELLAVAPPQSGPYTTFQQLSFAPKFPLACIADDYIIPPTYPSFVDYRTKYESDEPSNDTNESAAAGFSPPGLPVPTPKTPSQWHYRDPKGVVHGPWKSSLMQAWYKQGLLPPDLPVRRVDDEEFTLLKELRLQSVDPTQPFTIPPAVTPPPMPPTVVEKPLLSPISLLAQPRHFGPPALFFSSRGGHSTSIVDSRGRSVLKGKFVWTSDDSSDDSKVNSRMGDVKRLEAFDVQDKSVLVAMRQGGLEAVDLRDALLKPADESRTVLPSYNPTINDISRRPPFVWRIGTPIVASPTPFGALSLKSKSGFGNLSGRKASIASGKVTGAKADTNTHDPIDLDAVDGVFFVGRKGDEIYFCERNAGSFRILKLAPHA